MADLDKSESDTQPDNNCSWDLPSSSISSGQFTDDPARPHRKKYRSKSAVSNDPRSPYYTSPGLANEESRRKGFQKAPSVSCVPQYDCHQYPEVASKSQLPFNGGIAGLNLAPDDPKAATIRQHYYPEGGWGWVVCACTFLVEVISSGLQASFGLLLITVMTNFGKESTLVRTVLIGSGSMGVTLLLSPAVVSLSRTQSPRLLAVLGGLVSALACLFTSFASRHHQLYLSFSVVLGVGLGLARASASLALGQYFKRRREAVEVALASGTGLGTAAVPLLVAHAVSTLGWRLGLQAVTGLTSLTFILGVFYRPASLYHPQRRAILHLKGLQKRSKAKADRSGNSPKDKPPFFDLSVLRSRTVQILVAGSAFSAVGLNVPVLLLVYQARKEGLDTVSLLQLQAYLGLSATLGCCSLGFIVVRNSASCFIARQYLTQASLLLMALAILAFCSLSEHAGFFLFALVFGYFYGGYVYALRVFTFEKVRARNFSKAWGYIQCSQAVPTFLGPPLACYLNELNDDRSGFYFSSACIFFGAFLLFGIDVHKRNARRQKSSAASARTSHEHAPGSDRLDRRATYLSGRRVTLQDLAGGGRHLPGKHRVSSELLHRPELTCISEEVMMENIFDDFVDDCITSCNKEEKYLMLSEFENNLINTQESSSVSQEVRRLAQERKASGAASSPPPVLEHCPNCFGVVPIDGDTRCGFEADETPKKTHVSRSSAKRMTASRKKGDVVGARTDVIDKVTSSL